ncbi:MAG: PAS domain S-box protein [Sorangiineae bacterium]|nr:PAS domain S-box protein [Polyangiaceae bacterium]MEB2324083.1 PAS domain S-box protein [Sorangiineae bacterium]
MTDPLDGERAGGAERATLGSHEGESESARWLRLLDVCRDEIYLADWDTLRFEFVNATACRSLGYSKEELLDMSLLDLRPGVAASAFRARFAPIREGKIELAVFETVHRRKDGSEYPVEICLRAFSLGERTAMLAFVTDLTAQHRSRARLEHQLLEAKVGLNVSQALVGLTSEQQALDTILEAAGVFPEAFVSIVTFDGDSGDLDATLRRLNPNESGLKQIIALGTRFPLSVFTGIHQLESGEPMVSNDIATDQRIDEAMRLVLVEFGARSQALVPMAIGEELLGFFVLESRQPGYFDEAKVSIYRALAERSALTLRSARLREAVRASEQRLALIVEQSPLGVIEWDTERRVASWNPAAERILGRTRAEALDRESETILGEGASLLSLEESRHGSLVHKRPSGEEVACEWFCTPLSGAAGDRVGALSLVLDVTARQRAEEQRERLEAQLRQAQRLETVGRLAGGVAHDFNNMLVVILGYADILLSALDGEDPRRVEVQEIRAAAEHSRELTRQLLGFSRQQIASPQTLDVNDAVEALRRALARLIGEDVELVVALGAAPALTELDPAQLDQIIVNLAINARDAMPDGGTLTIETANVTVDEAYCQSRPDATPGRYVKLSVSDNGTGMSAATLEHVFEPFFTTKERGKGTGLGLATVYGIVRQNQGLVNAYSELGRGSTFNVYFRASTNPAVLDARPSSRPEPERPRAERTVLLVEDEEAVRRAVATMLSGLGYRVLVAASASAALVLARDDSCVIDLLLTDVVMPTHTGPQLRDELARLRPGVAVVFMSGYTSNVIVHHGILEPGLHFLQKPFTQADLAARLEAALAEPARDT